MSKLKKQKKDEVILGIHCGYGHDSGVAVVKNGKIFGCLAEERVSRYKKDSSFPYQAIARLLDYLEISPEQINRVALGAKDIKYMPKRFVEEYFRSGKGFFHHDSRKTIIDKISYFLNQKRLKDCFTPVLLEILFDLGFNKGIEISYVDHHDAHLASVFCTSGLLKEQESYIVILDAYGDGKAASVFKYTGDKLGLIYMDASVDSTPGQVYSRVTEYLGMKASRHEGKVTGLAAYGKSFDLKQFKGLICFDLVRKTFRRRKSFWAFLGRRLKGYSYYQWMMKRCFEGRSKEDVASITQMIFEKEIKEFFKRTIPSGFSGNILLAGGVFANVSLNYRIAELFPEANIYIHPGMSDEGIALGAALYSNGLEKGYLDRLVLNNVYLGTSYDSSEIKEIVFNEDLNAYQVIHRDKNYEMLVAELIDYGAVVGLFNGRMEYGPRALGNRSILIQPRDKNINHIVNARLNRTEYMPFAPVVLEEEACKIFDIPEGLRIPIKYMTSVVFVKSIWRKRLGGVVHVDGTARPQTISRDENALYYDILKSFYNLTDIPVMVNTSFNLHEEPIVEHPREAIQMLKSGAIDAVCYNDFLVVNKRYWSLFLKEYKNNSELRVSR